MISPARFIPIAEESGFIVPIGTWVLQEACRQNYLWQRAGYDPIQVAVNISAQQFAQIDFVSAVEQALSSSGLEARYLELELAEPVLMRNVQVAARRLLNLKALGIRLSMDDVGTGVLSLKEMVGLPVDALKIDVPFVRGMNETPGTLRLVKAILGLGHSLGMDVIAEGVETEEQLEQLRQLGCDKAQGYLFSAAVTAGDSEAYQTPASLAPDQEEPL
jgi:EAL domain-containing protein (putative c-di-GMP-specific phosphodiesterase class I)